MKVSDFRGGYLKVSTALNRVFDIAMSLSLLICASPVMVFIGIVNWVCHGRPVLYSSARLGKDKVPFKMYKFRSMAVGADRKIGQDILNSNLEHITHLGKFLRFTRLDELPQLFNILQGDMMFVGPRPLPPILYETVCKQIKGFDKRFSIKPGLIGYSQLFTPHSSPSKIRSLIDNKYLSIAQRFPWDFFLVVFTIVAVLKNTLVRSVVFFKDAIARRILRKYREKRQLERVRPRGSVLLHPFASGLNAPEPETARIIDMNEEAILVHASKPLIGDKLEFQLRIVKKNRRGIPIVKTAHCAGSVFRNYAVNDGDHPDEGQASVIRYIPLSQLNHYIVHQYFLRESIS
jgi:lipopolysaccharide/colanic/teichoic acid biosynthesis glycosyltransferase